ncbi:hypothetical protein RCZ04_09530 [Capnocytophaga sp. HP1101]
MYLAIVHKNAFEERLALFRPTHQLPQKRETYMQGVRKYRKYANITLMLIFYLPLCAFTLLMLNEGYHEMGRLCIPIPDEIKLLILLALVPVIGVHYLISRVLKRNEKALRMLLERMSDSDFELLLEIKGVLPISSKYNPPFVLCKHRLYLFIFYMIREIDPAEITDMKCYWGWGRGRSNVFVRIKLSKKMIGITMLEKVFPYFEKIVKKYTKTQII